jgi:hypothetical protein
MNALFDDTDHATLAGWATYHQPARRCRFWRRHPIPPTPDVADGIRPDNYARCRCGAWLKWFRVGQHRYGGMDDAVSSETGE